jgi:hypothetical protein
MTSNFSTLSSLAGGAMIGLAAVLLMLFKGRIAGISGIASRLFPPYADGEFAGRAGFVLGLVLAPAVYGFASGIAPATTLNLGLGGLIGAGLLVGFGSVLGNGCTSGHGVCGLSRLSFRSIIAVGVFMTAAIATTFVVRNVIGS